MDVFIIMLKKKVRASHREIANDFQTRSSYILLAELHSYTRMSDLLSFLIDRHLPKHNGLRPGQSFVSRRTMTTDLRLGFEH